MRREAFLPPAFATLNVFLSLMQTTPSGRSNDQCIALRCTHMIAPLDNPHGIAPACRFPGTYLISQTTCRFNTQIMLLCGG